MAKDIVKGSPSLREELKKRTREELKLTLKMICDDATSRGQNISIHSLSKYFSNSDVNNLSQEAIVWLSYRYGIYITLGVGVPKIKDNKVKFEVLPYNEATALKMLDKVFPPSVKKKK